MATVCDSEYKWWLASLINLRDVSNVYRTDLPVAPINTLVYNVASIDTLVYDETNKEKFHLFKPNKSLYTSFLMDALEGIEYKDSSKKNYIVQVLKKHANLLQFNNSTLPIYQVLMELNREYARLYSYLESIRRSLVGNSIILTHKVIGIATYPLSLYSLPGDPKYFQQSHSNLSILVSVFPSVVGFSEMLVNPLLPLTKVSCEAYRSYFYGNSKELFEKIKLKAQKCFGDPLSTSSDETRKRNNILPLKYFTFKQFRGAIRYTLEQMFTQLCNGNHALNNLAEDFVVIPSIATFNYSKAMYEKISDIFSNRIYFYHTHTYNYNCERPTKILFEEFVKEKNIKRLLEKNQKLPEAIRICLPKIINGWNEVKKNIFESIGISELKIYVNAFTRTLINLYKMPLFRRDIDTTMVGGLIYLEQLEHLNMPYLLLFGHINGDEYGLSDSDYVLDFIAILLSQNGLRLFIETLRRTLFRFYSNFESYEEVTPTKAEEIFDTNIQTGSTKTISSLVGIESRDINAILTRDDTFLQQLIVKALTRYVRSETFREYIDRTFQKEFTDFVKELETRLSAIKKNYKEVVRKVDSINLLIDERKKANKKVIDDILLNISHSNIINFKTHQLKSVKRSLSLLKKNLEIMERLLDTLRQSKDIFQTTALNQLLSELNLELSGESGTSDLIYFVKNARLFDVTPAMFATTKKKDKRGIF